MGSPLLIFIMRALTFFIVSLVLVQGSPILKEIISGYRVSQWKPSDPVNPEELGEYFKGDIMGDITRNGMLDERYRWPGGVVPYVIHHGFSSHDLAQLATAREVYETKTEGCIRWVERTDEKDYVNFKAEDSGCHSSVGRVGHGQTLNLHSPGCLTRIGTVEHEMLHALGFHHMQSTSDRDEFVEIMWDNIQAGKEHNFKKYSDGEVTDFGVSYDYGSVMHYSRHAFSKNGEDTIAPYDEDAEIGQRVGLSDKDLAKLLRMYNCPALSKYKHLLE